MIDTRLGRSCVSEGEASLPDLLAEKPRRWAEEPRRWAEEPRLGAEEPRLGAEEPLAGRPFSRPLVSFARLGAVAALACAVAASSLRAAEVDPAVLEAEHDRVAVVARASAAAVAVMAPGGQGGGSAVLVSADGYAVSNFHVTSEAGEAMKCGLSDGRLYDAVIVGVDPTGDAALLQLLGRDDFPHAELADSDQVRVGDWCFAIGNPFLLATDFKPTVTFGVISGVHRYQFPAGTLLEYTDCLQADAAINPGNSGGPLFDAEGRLIGINGRGSFEKRGRVNVGVGYAISINQIKNFLGQLKTGRVVDHATLGASVATNSDGRVLVDDILEASDAFRRGLRYGDEILEFGGRPITSANALKNVLGIFPKGWRVPLTYRRVPEKNAADKGVAAEPVHILVRLSGVHRAAELESLIAGEHKIEPNPEQPAPGKKPRSKKPEQPAPGQPKPAHARHARPKAPLPEIVKQRFTAKAGYVNYFFNQLNQDRVWKAAMSGGDFTTAGGKWTLGGELAEGGEWQITLDDHQATIQMPGGELALNADTPNLSKSLAPPESGGLLTTLWLWRRMLVGGPSHFGQTRYAGSEPLLGRGPLHDVLVGDFQSGRLPFRVRSRLGPARGPRNVSRRTIGPVRSVFSGLSRTSGPAIAQPIRGALWRRSVSYI